ncbi:MAG: hypothetical protein J6Y29_00755 [Clostridiales bacterium]|nr:hypothetical protein [Clostridiales bacterium]
MPEELISEKTYFIMNDLCVKTFYRAKINNHTIDIYVFNRNSETGEEVLDLKNVQEVYTSGTKKFDMDLYKLVNFISEDLTSNIELRKFFVEVWNEFSDKIFEMQFDNPSLPEKLKEYLDSLEKTYENPYIVAFFKEKYYFQKFKFVPYSEEWFKHHLANKTS